MLSVALLSVLVAAAPPGNHLKLASPGFAALNTDPKLASFFADHFANQLSAEGIAVITASEISTLLGLERQKQLMGCGEDTSCLAELGGALGAEGVITGTFAKFGNTVQLNLKIIHSRDGSALAVASLKTGGEEQMLEELSRTAASVAPEMLRKTGRQPKRTVSREVNRPKNVISINPVGMALGFLGLEYERTLTDYVSAFAGASFLSPHAVGTQGYLGILGARIYLFGTSPAGVHLQLSAGYANGSIVSTPILTGPSIGARALIGYSWLLFGGSGQLAVGIGAGWNFTGGIFGETVTDPNTGAQLGSGPQPLPDARFNFGFAF